jgi:hypothetical protein
MIDATSISPSVAFIPARIQALNRSAPPRSAKEKPAEKVSFEQFKLSIRQDNSLSNFVPMKLFDEAASPSRSTTIR